MTTSKVSGKIAVTHYETLKNYDDYSHIKLKLETGRTHQIRVHMSYLKHPVLGDAVYGRKEKKEFEFLNGQCLHAKVIGFYHPTSKKYLRFESDLPLYFKKVLEILENNH